jgi:hypothetical protein
VTDQTATEKPVRTPPDVLRAIADGKTHKDARGYTKQALAQQLERATAILEAWHAWGTEAKDSLQKVCNFAATNGAPYVGPGYGDALDATTDFLS